MGACKLSEKTVDITNFKTGCFIHPLYPDMRAYDP